LFIRRCRCSCFGCGDVFDSTQFPSRCGAVCGAGHAQKYGYIILPIGIPEEALKDNDRYRVVWQVLQALRAHDDRFNAIINKLELNNNRPPQIDVIGVGGGSEDSESVEITETQLSFNLPEIEEWKEAIYAKIVLKCGDRRYWEDWAKDVAVIADHHTSRIKGILAKDTQIKEQFDRFVHNLQAIINPSIKENDAIEMLSQHLITKPVFDALFSDYEFTKYNPISVAMQKIIDVLEGQSLAKETEKLDTFYASVKNRASGIDNAEGRQKIIVELYDKFFKLAFPKVADRLGIVYTPVEIVDFIVHSADAALKQEFGVGLTDKDVSILDPFTGTGTFIVRLLQSGLIKPEDLPRKYTSELHANEILLLPYYIAAINIETAYYSLFLEGKQTYQPFNGIVLTDTFQMNEQDGTLNADYFPENNQRVLAQKQAKIQVIISNPPYSAGQKSENDSNKNLKYPRLDSRIADTYAKYSSATNKNSLYDSYIRAIRWASDRIQERGVICFVTNGSFIDNNAMDGLRKCLLDDFTSIYVFNLRGNQRTSGETSRMEGGKIFGSGSRASIAITLLVRNPNKSEHQLYYHDIGDYLSREEKLEIIRNFGDFTKINWERLPPNAKHDWINIRNPEFETFIPLGDRIDNSDKSIFDLYSRGIATSRDAWCYNFSRQVLIDNMTRMIEFYNSEVQRFREYLQSNPISSATERQQKVETFVNTDPKKISWSRGLKNDLGRLVNHEFIDESVVIGMYRPYCKQVCYFNRQFNDMVYQQPKFFPAVGLENVVICVTGIGAGKEFSALIVDTVPNLHLQDTGQCFPLYTYEKVEDTAQGSLLETQTGYIKKDNIPDAILRDFQQVYDDTSISKEDIFYFVYGILHSPEYKTRFASDLKKSLPRIPLAQDFWAFSKAGRKLAHWHLHYETIEPYPLEEVQTQLNLDSRCFYRVTKNAKAVDKTTIIYNSNVKLVGIPLEAYQYTVCGRSAIEWIMERYQVTVDKDSGIRNDPNDWSDDPRYIIDLLKRIVRVSVETVTIVNSLPPLHEINRR
jgi:predicted helicase